MTSSIGTQYSNSAFFLPAESWYCSELKPSKTFLRPMRLGMNGQCYGQKGGQRNVHRSLIKIFVIPLCFLTRWYKCNWSQVLPAFIMDITAGTAAAYMWSWVKGQENQHEVFSVLDPGTTNHKISYNIRKIIPCLFKSLWPRFLLLVADDIPEWQR